MKRKFCFRFVMTIVAFSFSFLKLSGQPTRFYADNEFHDIIAGKKNLKSFLSFSLDEKLIKTDLANAPQEFKANKSVDIVLPMPDGESKVFKVYETPLLAPAIEAQSPGIKTYTGRDLNNPAISVTITVSNAGFNALILQDTQPPVYIERYGTLSKKNIYLVYSAVNGLLPDALKYSSTHGCQVKNVQNVNQQLNFQNEAPTQLSTGETKKTFRLAMAATAEFTAQNGGTQDLAFSALVAYVNRLRAVYERELSVSFTLVSGKSLVYTDANTDPYDNSDNSSMQQQNQSNLDGTIGNGNYDIGHVLGSGGATGDGLSAFKSVCVSDIKGKGVSRIGDGSIISVFYDKLFSHEVGHQFGMNHTFNSEIGVCGDNTRNASTSVEPGSGITIMSYSFLCADANGNDNYETTYVPILNFHSISYYEAINYIGTISCYSSIATGNNPPVFTTFTNNKTIPVSTPFALIGKATDPNPGDAISYSWEGANPGLIVPDATTLDNELDPPYFRSYLPSGDTIRYFPRLTSILDGTNKAKGDKLPFSSVTTHNRLTIRDGKGGVSAMEINIVFDQNSGPFKILPDPTGQHEPGSEEIIKWNVSNTDKAPVNCALVDILLSVDGGYTFPYLLAKATKNDGEEKITYPELNECTEKARIKIKATDNIFFDISDVDFSILTPDSSIKIFNSCNTPAFTSDIFRTIAVGSDGVVWAGTPSQGLYQYNMGVWRKWNVSPYQTVNYQDIKADRQGTIWVAQSGINGSQSTYGGIINFKDTTLTNYDIYTPLGNGLPTRNPRSLFVDTTRYNDTIAKLPVIWSAHYATTSPATSGGLGRGVYALAPNFTKVTYHIDSTNNTGGIFYIGGDTTEIWAFASNNYGKSQILRYNARNSGILGEIDATDILSGLASLNFAARGIYFDAKGNKWVTVNGEGILIRDKNGIWKKIAFPELFTATPGFTSNSITGDSSGNVYIGCSNGLIIYKGGHPVDLLSSYSRYTVTEGLPSNNVLGICVDTLRKRLLLATTGGIGFWKPICKPPQSQFAKTYSTIAAGDANTPSIWCIGLVPDSNTNIIVKHPITITTNTTVKSVQLIAPGSISVSPGVQFSILKQ